jgi:hypothetical protein
MSTPTRKRRYQYSAAAHMVMVERNRVRRLKWHQDRSSGVLVQRLADG